ncbi:MAG: tetratricopeptide repeat protein [Gemmatimonadetes bacterium]|nr:tetratricopeptide repeat protein [Gemmatimonadota bacterium]
MSAPRSDPRWSVLALLVALLAVAAAATSLRNGFTYDDRWIIAENGRVHALRPLWRYFEESYWPMKNGAGLYRPLVIFAYAVQWAIGNGSPFVFHLVNVLLAAAVAVAVFWVLSLLVPTRVAWPAAALFAVHPVHVEAVANVVGQAELWAALFILVAVGLYLRDRQQGLLRRQTGGAIVALFLCGIFTKEHVIVLPALLVAAEWLLFDDAPFLARLRRLRLLLWPLVALAAVFIAIRVQVLGAIGGDVPHPSLLHQDMLQRAFIMLNVIPEYGRLMLAPMQLYADYSPRQVEVHNAADPSHLAGALLLLSTAALFGLTVRRAPVVAFGIAWFVLLLAPVTNVLLPTGILLAERTLYLPSAGAMLVVAWGGDAARARLAALRSPLRPLVPLVVGAALLFGVVRSSARNSFWHDSDTAFRLMAAESPLNFKAHYALGGQLFSEGDYRDGEREWHMAIALMPGYHALYMDLAHRYRQAHLCEAAIPLYRKALALEPELALATVSIAACQLELAQWRRARTTSRVAIADGMYKKAFRYIIERADSALVANDSLDPTIGAKWLTRRRAAR